MKSIERIAREISKLKGGKPKLSDWVDISYYLYCGLNNNLDLAINRNKISESEYTNLKEACNVYKEHCILSYDKLREKLEILKLKIKEGKNVKR